MVGCFLTGMLLVLASPNYCPCFALHISAPSVSSRASRNTADAIIEPATTVAAAPLPSRRALLKGAFSAFIFTPLNCRPASAAADQDGLIDIVIGDDYFSFGIPSTWKIITKPSPLTDRKTQKKVPTLFSAIDFQSGSVITVVQEWSCNAREYAQSDDGTCDILLPPPPSSTSTTDGKTGALLLSEETLPKDLSKLLIRHDDRDNAVLQGTSRLDSYSVDDHDNDNDMNDKQVAVATLLATTTLPSGGTYTDGMGIDRPNTIDRNVRAKAIVLVDGGGDGRTKLLSLWLSAPADEWRKPVMGTKLGQIWKSVKAGEKVGV